jgi:hypothetical protein
MSTHAPGVLAAAWPLNLTLSRCVWKSQERVPCQLYFCSANLRPEFHRRFISGFQRKMVQSGQAYEQFVPVPGYQVLNAIGDVSIAGDEQLHFPPGFYMKSAAALSSFLVAATRILTLQGSTHSRQLRHLQSSQTSCIFLPSSQQHFWCSHKVLLQLLLHGPRPSCAKNGE